MCLKDIVDSWGLLVMAPSLPDTRDGWGVNLIDIAALKCIDLFSTGYFGGMDHNTLLV